MKRATAFALVTSLAAFAAYRIGVERTALTQSVSQPVQSGPGAVRPPFHRHADFSGERASRDARGIADWVVDSGDNHGMPFVIVDKIDAKVFVFKPAGHLLGASAALLGLARGDDSAPGIGEKKLSQIGRNERTTPAGRFVAERGVNLNGDDIVWVDYDAGLSMHAVRTNNPRERRLQRLASPTVADNRISYGCINLPRRFYRDIVAPLFAATRGIVYVLPETRPVHSVFASYEVPAGPPPPVIAGMQ